MTSSKPWCEYTRLTQDRNGVKIGRKVQRDHNRAFAKRAGIEIGASYSDRQVTAADEDVVRDEYERMLADVAAGMWGGIIVWKIDRLTRLSFEFERCLRLVRKAHVFIATSDRGLTTETPTGVSMLRQDVNYAEQEIENIRARVTANKRKRAGKGLYHGGGRRPFGFAAPKHDKSGRVKNSGKVGVKHVEHEVALLRDAAYRIAFKGETYGDVIRDWHSRSPPIYGATGAPWNTKTLQTILTSPRMVGLQMRRIEDRDTGVDKLTPVKAKWDPVLDKRTWETLRRLVTHTNQKEGRLRYLLTGIAECGRCHRPLTGATRKYLKGGEMVGTRTYRCRSMPNDKARGACGKLSVVGEPVEQLVLARIFRRLARARAFPGLINKTDDIYQEIERVSAEIAQIEGEIGILSDAQKSPGRRLPMAEYLDVRQPFVEECDAKRVKLASLMQALDNPYPVGGDFDDLPAWYAGLTEGQQRKLVLAHIKKVVVLPLDSSGRYFDPTRVVVSLADAQEVDGEGE